MSSKHPMSRLLVAMAAVAAMASLSACGKNEDQKTAGQQLDSAIAEVKQTGAEVKAQAEQAGTQAAQTVERKADEARQVVEDTAIASKIKLALGADDRLKARQIEVEASAGHVTLSGVAPDAASRDRASTLASAVVGVRSVTNRLTVEGRS